MLFLGGCVSAGQKFFAGEPKNSLPFLAKDLIEDIHSIAVPPFSGDRLAWHEAAQELLAQAPKASLIPQNKLDSAIRASIQDPVLLLPEERIKYAGTLGKSVQADAVLNGIILDRADRHELILQLVSSKDSRVLWFQAADFSYKDNQIAKSNQKELLSSMLSPLLPLLGKREKPGLPAQSKQEMQHKVEPVQKPEAQQNTESQPKSDKKNKMPKRPDKGVKPQQELEDVSPM